MNLIFLGAPGSGKGTHSSLVCDKYAIPHISTGDILRENIKTETELGKKAKGYIDNGQLVPDDIMIAIVKQRLSQADCEKGYLLDGFPRTIEQAEALSDITDIDLAVNLLLDDEIIISRLSGRMVCVCGETYNINLLNGKTTCAKCGKDLYVRDDDRPETVQKRLNVYHQKTAPLIDYYESKGLLKNVDASLTIEATSNEIFSLIDKL